MDILGFNVPVSAPQLTDGTLGTTFMYVLGFLIFAIALFLIGYIIIDRKAFNKKIVVFENTGAGYRLVLKDRARLIKLGDGGEEVLYLRNKKVYRSAYGRKMGTNEYWFAIGQDGYWYNIMLGDLDAKMGMLDIEPIDRDMRYMHVALRKNTQDRYNSKGFMDKYGQQIFLGLLAIIFFIGMWFTLEQVSELMKESSAILVEVAKSVEPMREALGRVDTICSGGSGLGGLG